MSMHMCLSLMVIMMLLHNIFHAVISTVLVVSSSGYFMRLMPEVILTRLGYIFCGE